MLCLICSLYVAPLITSFVVLQVAATALQILHRAAQQEGSGFEVSCKCGQFTLA